MAESENARKKRLAKQSKAAKANRKPANKKAQEASRKERAATRSTDDTNINKMVELGLPIPPSTGRTTPAPKKRKEGTVLPITVEEEPENPKLTVYPDDPTFRGEFVEVQKERDLSEIGKLGVEATPKQRKARETKLKKYSEEIAEMGPASTVPKNEPVAADSLRPKMEAVDPTPSPSQAARQDARTAPGGSGAGIFTFDGPRPAEMPRQDIRTLIARRSAKGLPGLPGDENGINGLALGLAKRDHAIAKTAGKIVNTMDPEGDAPTHIDQIYFGHHRRLAEVMLKGGLSEEEVAKSAPGSGRTFEKKVSYLHKLLVKHEVAKDTEPVNLQAEGITHWIHPTTGVAHAIADNHPDMPKVQPEYVKGGQDVDHGFYRGNGVADRVRKDNSTGTWVADKLTGNKDVDASLGWDPSKPMGYTTVNLRGGIKALKRNMPPTSGRSLWEHEVNDMKSTFPQSISGDSRLQHKAYANRILQDASKSEVDGRVLARNRAGEPVPKINRKTGKLAGMIVTTGRSVQMGFTVDKNGEAQQTTGIATSRARVLREGAPSPTKPMGGAGTPEGYSQGGLGYSEGGSTRVDRTTEQPERIKIVEFQNKKISRKKSRIVDGRKVVAPPVSGVSGGGGYLKQKRELAVMPKIGKATTDNEAQTIASKQFEAMRPSANSFGRGGYILGAEPAEPITQGKVTYTKNVMPDPEAVKKNPKSKKTITKFERNVGMVDQMLPGFETAGLSNKFKVVEGPITRVQQVEEETGRDRRNLNSAERKTLKGRVYYTDSETPIADSVPKVSGQLAKIVGNSPVNKPVAEGPAKTVRSYRKNRMEAPVAAPAKPAAPKERSEQLAFPGMEPIDTSHAAGQQWLNVRNLSPETRELQKRSRREGVPGGSNPINVARGTEAPKSNKSFK